MKTVYMFYLCDNTEELTHKKYPGIYGLEIISGNNFNKVLYAWTVNKTIRKKFKQQRDMKKFKEVVCEIDYGNFNKFSDKYSTTFLEERSITTKALDEDNNFYEGNAYILTTSNELDYMVEHNFSIMQKLFGKLLASDIYIKEDHFASTYRKILHKLQFDEFITSFNYPLDDYDTPFSVFTQDSLAIYTHLYCNTYRKD